MRFTETFNFTRNKNSIRELSFNDYAVFAFSITIICLLIVNLLDFGYGRDQAIFSLVARTMVNGGAPYLDAWDFKTPGVYFVYALEYMILGGGELQLRIFETFNILLMFYGFIILSKRLFQTAWAAVFPCLIAAINYILPGYWSTAQAESFAAAALTWAIIFATYVNRDNESSDKRVQYLAWALAAALFTFSGILKPPLGGGIITSFLIIVYSQYRLYHNNKTLSQIAVPVIVAFAIGSLVPLLLTLFYLVVTDSFDSFYYLIFVYLPHYTSISSSEHGFIYMFIKANYIWLLRYPRLHLLGLVFLFLLPAYNDKERTFLFHILGACLFCIIGIALQAKFFSYHYAAVTSLSGLLSGWGLWKAWMYVRKIRLAYLYLIITFVIFGILPTGRPGNTTVLTYWEKVAVRLKNIIINPYNQEIAFGLNSNLNPPEHRHITKWNLSAKGNHLVSEWIAENTPEGSSIFVWGFEPSIYLYSNRRLASRYIYNVAQRTPWSKSEAQSELTEELSRAMPAAVIIQKGDVFKVVTGNDKDSYSSLQDYPEFQQLLNANYEPAITIESFVILKRRS